MGAVVSFRSTRVLVQREDQAGALVALRLYASECPEDVDGHDPGGDSLVALLDAWGWGTALDSYGDIVGLWYWSDKAPRGGCGVSVRAGLRACAVRAVRDVSAVGGAAG